MSGEPGMDQKMRERSAGRKGYLKLKNPCQWVGDYPGRIEGFQFGFFLAVEKTEDTQASVEMGREVQMASNCRMIYSKTIRNGQ